MGGFCPGGFCPVPPYPYIYIMDKILQNDFITMIYYPKICELLFKLFIKFVIFYQIKDLRPSSMDDDMTEELEHKPAMTIQASVSTLSCFHGPF